MTCFVVDISNWQGDVDMAPWKGAGIEGCIAKALEGMTGVDNKWASNKAKMLRWGGVPGAYHYMNKIHPGEDQCNAFLDLVPANFIHALDAEAPGPLDVDGWFRAYRRRYPRKVVWLYTNLGMWRQISKLPVINVPDKYGPVAMWVAGSAPGAYAPGTDDFRKIWARVPAGSDGGLPFLGFTTYVAMQFSGSASVPGVPSPCDMSIFGGSAAELRSYTSTNGVTDDMSQADVDAIVARINRLADEVADALGGRASFRDKDPYDPARPLTWDRILNELLRRSDDPRDLTSTGRDALAAQLGKVDADALAQAKVDIVNGVVSQLQAGVHVDPTDPKVISDLLGQQLDEHLGKLRIVTAQ